MNGGHGRPTVGASDGLAAIFILTLATLLFLALNGHLLLVQILIDSFQSLPVSTAGLARADFWSLVGWGSRMFSGALMIALTALTAMLLINVAFGVMSRAAPQLNIFGVGFPVMMGAGFIVIMLSLPGMAPQVSNLMSEAFQLMRSLSGGG